MVELFECLLKRLFSEPSFPRRGDPGLNGCVSLTYAEEHPARRLPGDVNAPKKIKNFKERIS